MTSWGTMEAISRRMSAAHRAGTVLLAALITVAPGLMAGAQSLASQADFTADVAKQFERANPGATVTIAGPLTIELTQPGGTRPSAISLDRMWNYCGSNADDCANAVEMFVADLTSGEKEVNGPIDRAMLRVVVRRKAVIDAGNQPALAAGKPDAVLAAAPFAGGLWRLCVDDMSRAVKILRLEDLAKLGLSLDEAIALGTKNLAADLPPLSGTYRGVAPRVLGTIQGDGYYESSRLLLHDDWAGLANEMNGHLIVIAPAADQIFYASDEDPDAVEKLAWVADQIISTEQRPISDIVLKWTPEGWQVMNP